MRFIHVTRYGGVKVIPLSVAAIAYVDGCEGGAAIRLIGGESLRVNEDPATIESLANGGEEAAPKVPKGKRK